MALVADKLTELGLKLEASFNPASPGITGHEGLCVTNFVANLTKEAALIASMCNEFGTRKTGSANEGYEVSFTIPGLEFNEPATFGIGRLLASVMGADVISGAGDPFTHTFTFLDNVSSPSFTLVDRAGAFKKFYTGFRVGSVKFISEANTPVITLEVSGIAMQELDATAVVEVFTFGSRVLPSPKDTVLTIDTVAVTNYSKVEIEILRSLEPIHTLNSKSTAEFLASVNVAMNINLEGLFIEDEVLRNKYKNDQGGGIMDIDFKITQATSPERSLQILSPKNLIQTFDGPNFEGETVGRFSIVGMMLRDSGLKALQLDDKATEYDIV